MCRLNREHDFAYAKSQISTRPSYTPRMASTLLLKSALHVRYLYLNRYYFLLLRQKVHSYSYVYGLKPHGALMATAAATAKTDWLIIVPDHTGVLDKRMEVRPYI